jgi:DNA polymerase theta
MSTSGHQSHGFQTTVDIARQQAYHVAPVAGQKRSSEQSNLSPGLVTKVAFRGRDANSDSLLESAPLETARDLLASPVNRFTASKIHLAAGAGEALDEDRQRGASVPPSSQNPLLFLSNPKYGLPPALTANFAALGVKSIYPWQASCLLAKGLLSGERHLVYTAPTGGGKSLVADVLLLKRIIENPGRKALLVLPYVALVQEKLKWMRRIVQDVEKIIPEDDEKTDSFPRRRWKRLEKNIRVTGFFGGSRTTATWADTDIAVCTIEKVCGAGSEYLVHYSDFILRRIR